MVPPYSEIWLAVNLRNGWRAAAAGLHTGRKKAHSDTAVGIRIFEGNDGGRRRGILKRMQKVRASDARTERDECGLPLDSVDSAADVRLPHKNRLSRLGAMFFHCRAGSASPLKAGDHDRKAERLLYRSLSAFDMDGCSEALNRGRYQMVCSQWPNAYWIFLRRI